MVSGYRPSNLAMIRLSVGVLEAYRQSGPGWQNRIDEDLQEIVARRKSKTIPPKLWGG